MNVAVKEITAAKHIEDNIIPNCIMLAFARGTNAELSD